jgi:ornithine--oxo-acid transaminase
MTNPTRGKHAPAPLTEEHLHLADRFIAHNYYPLQVVLAEAEGSWVTDVDGRRYLDCLAG